MNSPHWRLPGGCVGRRHFRTALQSPFGPPLADELKASIALDSTSLESGGCQMKVSSTENRPSVKLAIVGTT